MVTSPKIIYSISKTGKTTQWQAELVNVPNSNSIEISILAGYTDGKKVVSSRLVSSGKNIGRSNETSIQEQAILELERLYTSKYEKGYKDSIEDVCVTKKVDGISKPMLADKYPEKMHKLPTTIEDIALQPKVDGLRCFVQKMEDNSIRFTSRSGKVFTVLPHIALEAQRELAVGDTLDGELYIEGEDLQYIMSVVSPSKNIKTEFLAKVQLYWYDFIPKDQEHLSFKERFLDSTLTFNNAIVKLQTATFYTKDSPLDSKVLTDSQVFLDILENQFDNYINRGFEGLMLRDITSPYYLGRRSTSLLKYKKMCSEEFEIIDIIESEQDEAPRFICDLKNGNTVTVRLKGNKEDNLKYLTNKDQYIGKWLTINYQMKTKTNSLQFPVGIMVREGTLIDNVFTPTF